MPRRPRDIWRGDKLRAARVALGASVEALARACEVDAGELARWERGTSPRAVRSLLDGLNYLAAKVGAPAYTVADLWDRVERGSR
jgi:transcriptional regulator with XRE-family HTH domain